MLKRGKLLAQQVAAKTKPRAEVGNQQAGSLVVVCRFLVELEMKLKSLRESKTKGDSSGQLPHRLLFPPFVIMCRLESFG